MDKLDKAVPVLSVNAHGFWFSNDQPISLVQAIALAKAGECNFTAGAYDVIKKHLPATPAVVDGAIDKSRSTQNARR